jgi:hypothetical protein
MGWKSTMEVHREDALRLVREQLDSLSDAELGNVLDVVFDDSFYNFVVVRQYDPAWGIRYDVQGHRLTDPTED